MTYDMTPDDETMELPAQPSAPFWRCEECGAADRVSPMPVDKAKYWAKPKMLKCKKCKSIGCVPVGF